MEQENAPQPPEQPQEPEIGGNEPREEQLIFAAKAVPAAPEAEAKPDRGLKWVFVSDEGLRAGWSAAIFVTLLILAVNGLAALFLKAHLITQNDHFTPRHAFFSELMQVIGLLVAALIMALIERRKILDYNLRGPRRVPHFFQGMVAGFVALSVLVGALDLGGWLHFGPVALSGGQIFEYMAIWGCVFLLVGCMEEGTMRCYLLYTLTRGINLWWAIAVVGIICLDLVARAKGNGAWGVYGIALLGLGPCLLLHLRKAPSAGFWQAAWVTSALFGFAHTGNNGENWIGIFAAALIGFVFCVSVWVTGSAWWAIGCHAAWDWSETYFYGTADSGLVAQGHLLTTHPAGSALWSGGADGPEGSLLVLPVVLLLLALLVVVYGKRNPEADMAAQAEPVAS